MHFIQLQLLASWQRLEVGVHQLWFYLQSRTLFHIQNPRHNGMSSRQSSAHTTTPHHTTPHHTTPHHTTPHHTTPHQQGPNNGVFEPTRWICDSRTPAAVVKRESVVWNLGRT